MDKTGVSGNSRNTIKTDLSLLLECLKFQMKSPDLQKQALLTIHSICEKREDNVDLLREMGGVVFVYNLSKSSIVHSDVKETALFTLGTLAEANVYCKNSLSRKETFADLAGCLMKDDIPLTQKRVSVYLLSVLVANNKLGQTLAQTTGCLDILLDLFRSTFPISTDATLRIANATQNHQLWTSVSTALCGCVNNPQNVEGQRICVSAFPIIKIWLQQIALPCTEIFQPICSFIAMTVANNACVQESFSASGCLETLTLVLVRQASAADTSLLSCQLSVTISKTLSACITDNPALASGLSQYGIVPHLISLLASPNLDPEYRLSVLLTLGHCTVATEEHQFQLVQYGGLPLIITLLTEDTSDEVRRAATFILQTCKQATMSLGVPGLMHGEGGHVTPLTKMESLKTSAREFLSRIDLLEKRLLEETENEVLSQPSLLAAIPRPLQPIKGFPTAYRQTSTLKHVEAGGDNYITLQNTNSSLSTREDKTSGGDVCSVCRGTGALLASHLLPLEGGREHHTPNSQPFKPPAPVIHSVPKEIKCTDGMELQEQEVSEARKILVEEHAQSNIRCAGCVLPFEEVTSRTFASLQNSCRHNCEMHKVLQEATKQFRTHHWSRLFRKEIQDSTVELTDPNSHKGSAAGPQRSSEHWNVKEVCLTPRSKGAEIGKRSIPKGHWRRYKGVMPTLTPLYIGAKKEPFNSFNKTSPCLTPLKRQHLPGERRAEINNRLCVSDDELKTSTDCDSLMRRRRKDFSHEEVCYLLSGVKMFGFSWNSILWSYPFQSGRTNVDLAKKYRRLMATRKNK
ncbi:telomere repeats-binding bouquet formation protein 1 isoform X2 [Anabas testudineus]|uniref:telomere repeats-binding bouquet formation protein 1 isoform X2 n=1 Tax=Anabas testudineus TaxID=64144 RepID=UPI000E456577|nr:telomere repeats-binding bouquet formation protein 1 isoform X2 [Anabas testudineus]